MKILLAEDEPQLQHVLKKAMQSVGYQVDAVNNGKSAVKAAKENIYDVMIFDVMMPEMTGIEAMKEIRKTGDSTHVIILTAMSEIDDKVTGLDAGADDYMTKPFSLKELLARLRSKERREDDYNHKLVEYGSVKLDTGQQELVSHNSIRLPSKETELMKLFMLNADKQLSTHEIRQKIWGDEENDEIVWIYISYLRGKLAAINADIQIVGKKDGEFCLTKK